MANGNGDNHPSNPYQTIESTRVQEHHTPTAPEVHINNEGGLSTVEMTQVGYPSPCQQPHVITQQMVSSNTGSVGQWGTCQ